MSIPYSQQLRGRSLIGSRLSTESSGIFYGINPATGEKLDPPYHAASLAEVEVAADLAWQAFADYRRTTGARKAAFLRKIADNIEALGDSATERMTLETALPAGRARSEQGRTCGQMRMFADLIEEGSWVDARIDREDSARIPLPKPDVRFMLRALGPVAVFGPANFPLAFAVAGGDTASALAAGCPVIVKAHAGHPGTSELIGLAVRKAVEDCGLPAGVFSLLFDVGTEVGTALVKHPSIKAVGFTGSRKAGRALHDLAAARRDPIPVFAEMSSSNPVFILPRALRERGEKIAGGLHASVTLGVGQFCTNPGLVMFEKCDEAELFACRLSQLMEESPEGVMLNRGIRESYDIGLRRLGAHERVRSLVSGECESGTGGTRAAAGLFQTDGGTFLRDPLLGEEIFGPVTLLVASASRQELLLAAKALDGHLTATVHGTDEDLVEYRDLIDVLETKVGRLLFNSYPTGVEVCASMNHGGPYPATTDCRFTSVGTAAIYRFVRPACYQNCPQQELPPELRDGNPRGIWRLVDNNFTRD